MLVLRFAFHVKFLQSSWRGCYTPSNLHVIKAVVLLSSCHNSWEKLWKLKSICGSKSGLDSYMQFCFASWGTSLHLWVVSYSFPINYSPCSKVSFIIRDILVYLLPGYSKNSSVGKTVNKVHIIFLGFTKIKTLYTLVLRKFKMILLYN